MKTYLAQMHVVPGDLTVNLATVLSHIDTARSEGADLVVFPELCLSGYLIGDRWHTETFLRDLEAANETVRRHTAGLVVVWGSVYVDWDKQNEDGSVRKYNAAFVAKDGAYVSVGHLQGYIPKTNLPTYGIFDDQRYFTSGERLADELGLSIETLLQPVSLRIGDTKQSLGLMVCEDMWDEAYATKVARTYRRNGATLLVNISCSPWYVGKQADREAVMRARISEVGLPLVFVNSVSLQDTGQNLVLIDGGSAVMSADGCVVARAPQFHTTSLTVAHFVADTDTCEFVLDSGGARELYEGFLTAMRLFFTWPRVVIGLSGGVDSAVMATLLVHALGPDRVLALNMPSAFNSETTRSFAAVLASKLGIAYRVLPLEETLAAFRSATGSVPGSLVDQNVQARLRGNYLATVAQSVGGVFTCNGNKTELALNYATLYGDLAGAVAFLADLWKGDVYTLGRFINEQAGREIIPRAILDPDDSLVPSAELSAEHAVDERKGDPIFYPFHDALLMRFMEDGWSVDELLARTVDQSVDALDRVLRVPAGTTARYFTSRVELLASIEWTWRGFSTAFKHVQAPPVFIVSPRAYGFDYREAVLPAPAFGSEYQQLREAFLASPWE